jgi:hypothetical protein
MTDARSAAHFLAGKAVAAFIMLGELRSLSVANPDVILSEAKTTAASALAQYLSGPEGGKLAKSTLKTLLAGNAARIKCGTDSPAWNAAFYPLHSELALSTLRHEADRFVGSHWHSIGRVAASLLANKELSVGLQGWLMDRRPDKQAA